MFELVSVLPSMLHHFNSPSIDFIDSDVPLFDETATDKLIKCEKKRCIRRSISIHTTSSKSMKKDVEGGFETLTPSTITGNGMKAFEVKDIAEVGSLSNAQIVTLNVAGMRFQTTETTLEEYPDTLLGDPLRRKLHFNPETGEYFFDRHRSSFESILYFYQSRGRIKRPEFVPLDMFLKELKFFEMSPEIMDKFWASEGYIKPPEAHLPKNKLQRELWQLLEHPDSSIGARVFAFFSIFVIVISIVSFCLETIPHLKELAERRNGTSGEEARLDWGNPFFVLEVTCIVWFTLEFLLRFISCPSKLVFCKSFLNIIDVVAIVPFYISNLFMRDTAGGSAMSFAVLRVLRLVRVFRIFKLSRHSVGLQILGKTFAASVQELCLLVFFLVMALVLFSSAVYFAEVGVAESQFESIPAAFWYAIVTMTTVGYGDITPKGPWGKLVGGCTSIIGVLVLALPVPVIVSNFKHFYKQETRLAQMRQLEDNADVIDNISASS